MFDEADDATSEHGDKFSSLALRILPVAVTSSSGHEDRHDGKDNEHQVIDRP
jgi:hypothetical protein